MADEDSMLENDQTEEECPMCGGEGGWPHPLRPGGFEKCRVCNGTGKITPDNGAEYQVSEE
ncbi:MAG: hypothetical protein KZQ99_14480 [Candidatus Thiodiazotropha sp. (ex Dulcina madagascariensis)]|nr:hypothetical protein [Candidatus Thiodiazotropha sp. (ex Dulcina madagascariensis)]